MKLLSSILVITVLNYSLASPVPQDDSDAACPTFCPAVYAPVCGTDDKTYDSECKLKTIACKTDKTIAVNYEGDCVHSTKPEISSQGGKKPCNVKCNRDYKPVCGSDGATYNNLCLLELAACQNDTGSLTHVSDGPCEEEKRESRSAQEKDDAAGDKKVCNPKCNREFRPVCGSDKVTYNNICLLEFAACDSQVEITKVSNGKCPDPVDVNEEEQESRTEEAQTSTNKPGTAGVDPLPPQGKPQTGGLDPLPDQPKERDGRQNKDAEEGSSPANDCVKFCPLLWKPICGSDGTTYGNECELSSKNCINKKEVTTVHEGACEEEDKKDDDDEEEGSGDAQGDAFKGASTKGNSRRQSEDDEKVEEEDDDELEEEDKNPCPEKCSDNKRPVCGSNNTTYTNLCQLNREKCRSNAIINLVGKGACPDDKRKFQ